MGTRDIEQRSKIIKDVIMICQDSVKSYREIFFVDRDKILPRSFQDLP